MRFLCDHDVYAVTSRFLADLGHDVALAARIGMAQAEDAELLHAAREQSRIFITRDRDLSALVFIQGHGPGVIYLRILPATLQSVHDELGRVLERHAEEELLSSFVVVEPGGHRIRRAPLQS